MGSSDEYTFVPNPELLPGNEIGEVDGFAL